MKLVSKFLVKNSVVKVISKILKHILDRILALLLIILTLPLMVLIALAIKIDDRGTVLFWQERTGIYGKKFNLCKFRTMIETNDVEDASISDQYTRVGKILRRYSLDELPQLFLILIGKMSFIGPRPWIHSYYENMTIEQRRRYEVLPGLTGLAQVNGRNNISIFDKIKFDLNYIENFSVFEDIFIVFLTVSTVLRGSGVDSGKEGIHEELEQLRAYKEKSENKIVC